MMPLPKFRGRTKMCPPGSGVQRSACTEHRGAVQELERKAPEIQAWSTSLSACVTVWAAYLLSSGAASPTGLQPCWEDLVR